MKKFEPYQRGQHSWALERENTGNSEDIENPFLKIYLGKGKDEQLCRQEAIMKDFFKNGETLQVFLIGHVLNRS